jgi:hypothetical protein
MAATAGRRLFDAYVFVDWSGRDAPSPRRPCADAIWVGEQAAAGDAPRETYWTTRQAATAYVFAALVGHAAAGRRVLVGFDFPYGYPAGLAAALDLPGSGAPWQRTWSALARCIVDGPDNRSNRFAVAAAWNARLGPPGPGPFWGCPPARQAPTLARTSPGFAYGLGGGRALARLRLTDRRVAGVQEAWKLLGVGSVGSQALLGIPRVHWLRQHPTLAAASRVWPMETGFTPTPTPRRGPFVLHTEVWPGIVPRDLVRAECANTGAIRDQAQVRLLCRWARQLDAAGDFGAHFAAPPDVEEPALQAVLHEEGWILGEREILARRASRRHPSACGLDLALPRRSLAPTEERWAGGGTGG